MKCCRRCGERKRRGYFHRDRNQKDGLSTICKECRRTYAADYYRRNSVKIKKQTAEWARENPETVKRLGWENSYRARSRAAGHIPVVKSFTRAELVERWGDRCFHCRTGPFEELDHSPVPVRLGGEHSLENCRPSCAACNRPGGPRKRGPRR